MLPLHNRAEEREISQRIGQSARGNREKEMREAGQSRVIGLLGVGFDTEDGQIRVTEAGEYRVIMGSGETHKALQKICHRINKAIKDSGKKITDFSPEEFMELVKELH